MLSSYKNIASFLVFLCLPCAPLLAVMMVILAKMPVSASITVYGLIFSQLLLVGWLANKILPGKRSHLILRRGGARPAARDGGVHLHLAGPSGYLPGRQAHPQRPVLPCRTADHQQHGDRTERLQPGEKGTITYIKPASHSNLQQLVFLGLNPGVVVTVHRKTPAFYIKYEQTELALDDEIAKNIFVWKVLGEGDRA